MRRQSIIVVGVGALGVGGDVLRVNMPMNLAAGAVLWLLSVVRPTTKKKKSQCTTVGESAYRISLVYGGGDRFCRRHPGRSQQH